MGWEGTGEGWGVMGEGKEGGVARAGELGAAGVVGRREDCVAGREEAIERQEVGVG